MTDEQRIDIINHSTAADTCTDEYPQWLWDRLEWFQDLKFGLFLHWGVYCQWGCIESWPLVEEDTWARPDNLACWTERGKDLARFRREYWALNRTFNPTNFDPGVWAEAAKAAGMQYVAFTTKHHDGFCMYDTQTTDYKITGPDCPFHTDPRANVAKEVFNAFRAREMAISCYFSKSDWKSPYYWDPARPAHDRNPNFDTHAEPERWAKFVEFTYRQIEELMTGYGPLDTLWLDGGQVRPPNQDIRMDLIAEMARQYQPGLIIADRTVGGVYENILTPEQEIPDTPLGHPWESCMTMGNGWGFVPNDVYKPARLLIHMLVDIVAKDGNFLLNIGPQPDGTLPAEALARLREIGAWMAINAEAIHGTRAIAPYQEGAVRFTCKGDTVHAIILAEEGQSQPPATITLNALRPAAGSTVKMLGVDAPLTWQATAAGAVITLPAGPLPCEHAWVVTFQQ
ncbi:MAG: alpha-L-fucosidase [Armatimonadota bacterium]